jgi:hypothetical protein
VGKRSNFERVERDYYPTPYKAIIPLLSHLQPNTTFSEPCAGDGRLVENLEEHGHKCVYSADIEPRQKWIRKADAMRYQARNEHVIITNPPWNRDILHTLINVFARQKPTWLLFDSDWAYTLQAKPYLGRLKKIVTIGRVKWIEGSKNTGKDNCCWYLFEALESDTIRFYGKG